MDFKKTITLLAVMCAFSSFGQELIAPYNMLWGSNGSSDVIDTVPSDEIWKVEAIGSYDMGDHRNFIEIDGKRIRVFHSSSPGLKLPLWLDSGDIITIPYYNNDNYIRFISILRFTKPD